MAGDEFFEVIRGVVGNRNSLEYVRPEHYDGECDYRATCWWLLGSDPERPNKRSKRLVITISQEAYENYRDGSPAVQACAIEKFTGILNERLKHYDPDHGTPYMAEEPTEHWLIVSADIIQY